ncbi:ribonuclease H-like domain-containing protein [Tanacetum coccineum]
MTGGSGSNVDSISSLDVGNPLHLQTNDNNTRNKMGFVDGTCTKATYASSIPLTNQWERCNAIVLSWLLGSISDDLYLSQAYSKNAAEVWKELKETYDKLDGLLSVNKLVKDRKLHVGFDEYDCIIQDLKKENILGTGSEAGGLYVFNIECKAQEFKSNNSFLCFNVSKGIWHNRLGHPSDQVMYVLKNRLSIGKPTHAMPCDVCHQAKQVREPFSLSEHKSDSLGDLIHLDLWGPYKVTTKDGFRYFLTVVDDYSRAVWVYLLKTKDEVYDHLIGEEEDFSKGNNFEHFEVPNLLFNTKESNTLRRSSRQSKLPPKLNDYVLNSKTRYDLDKFVNHTWLSAENCGFVQAMNEEMQALYENNTWDLVELPRNRRAIGSKWVYKTKLKSTGEIDRYKARLVAKGFNQKEGIDYEETFSPVVKIGTVRCLISLAVKNGWCLFQLDVNNAFLYGNLDEDAPRQWNNRLTEALIETGFQQSGHNHSLYTKEFGGSFIALLVYVDDIVLTVTYALSPPSLDGPWFKGSKVYADSDWAKCLVTRRSISGYCVIYNGCLVSWKSKKQATLSKSSTEAEYRSMAAATYELMWIMNILKGLKVTNLLPTELFCDNSAAIQIAANPVMHEKTKHFDLDVHIIR